MSNKNMEESDTKGAESKEVALPDTTIAEDQITKDEVIIITKSTDPVPPDGGWGWMVMIGSAVAHFLLIGTSRSFGVYFVVLKERLQTSSQATAWIIAIFNTTRQFLGPVAGMLCDRFTCRKVVIVGAVFSGLGVIVSSFGNSLIYIYLTFGVISGVGGSMVFAPSYIIVGQYFLKKKGKAMGGATLGSGVGTLILAPLLAFSLSYYGLFGTLLLHGALLLNSIPVGCLYRPLNNKPRNKVKEMKNMDSQNGEAPYTKLDTHNGKNLPDCPDADVEKQETTQPLMKRHKVKAPKTSKCAPLQRNISILRNRVFIIYCFQIMAMSVSIQTFTTYIPALAEEAGTSKAESVLLLSLLGISDMIGRFCFGFFFDLKKVRYRRRSFHSFLGLLMGLITSITGLMSSYVALLIMTLIYGFIEGGFHSQRATIINEFVSKDQMSSSVGFIIFSQGFGIIIGQPIAGAIQDISGTFTSCFFFAGSFIIVTSIVFLIDGALCKPRQESQN